MLPAFPFDADPVPALHFDANPASGGRYFSMICVILRFLGTRGTGTEKHECIIAGTGIPQFQQKLNENT
jgi:hypothetical protein